MVTIYVLYSGIEIGTLQIIAELCNMIWSLFSTLTNKI